MINEQALKDRLHTIAKEKEIPFNSCWKQLLLERFLARLSRSSHVNKFIFKERHPQQMVSIPNGCRTWTRQAGIKPSPLCPFPKA